MRLAAIPQAVLVGLGLLQVGCADRKGGDDGDTWTGPCLSPTPPTYTDTSTEACLSTASGYTDDTTTDATTDVCLGPEWTGSSWTSSADSSSHTTGTGTGTDSGSTDTNTWSGATTDSNVTSSSTTSVLDRVIRGGALPSDVVDRLRKRDKERK